MLKIKIPFSGFYNSAHDAMQDDILDQELDYFASEYEAANDACTAYAEFFNGAVNWKEARQNYVKLYVNAFNDYLENNLDINPCFTFQEMTSPREYNFSTDAIYGFIPLEKAQAIFEATKKEILEKVIKERHTSYDGFISFYANSLSAWPAEVKDWDEVQLETLVLSWLESTGHEAESWDIMEHDQCSGRIDETVWSAIPEKERAVLNWLREAIEAQNEKEFFEIIENYNYKESMKLKGEVCFFPKQGPSVPLPVDNSY